MTEENVEKEAVSEDVPAAAAVAAEPAKDEGPKIEYDAKGRRIWRVGNLTYTVGGLLALFFWLLWIDFTYTLMESVFGPILQFKLVNSLEAPAFVTGLLISMMPRVQSLFLTPMLGVASDRHRGPRGRRIPYLLWPTPIACALLALLGFSDDFAVWLNGGILSSVEPRMLSICVLGVLFFSFSIVNAFLSTIFYYLFNDVVPKEHIVKFFGYFRAVGVLAGMFYSFFIFKYSTSGGPLHIDWGFFQWHADYVWYPKLILCGMAVFYLFAFSLACLKVKEPEYPPPAPLAKGEGVIPRFASTIRTLFKECFSHPFYIFFFFVMTVEWMQYQLRDFQTPMLKELNLDLGTIGKVNAWTGPISLVLTILTANFGDYMKPVPLFLIGTIALAITAPIGFLYLIPGQTTDFYLWVYIIYALTHIPVSIINGLASWPLLIEMFPKSRYGQFSGAFVLTRELVAGIFGAMFAYWVMTMLQNHFGGTYYTRFSYLWRGGWQILFLFCVIILYRKWKKMGGKEHFKPPVSWDEEYGSEQPKLASK